MGDDLYCTDHALKNRVTDQLRRASDVDPDRVGVAVTDGAVTLSGEVDTDLEKEAVLRAAFRAEGLLALADEMVVRLRPGCEDVDLVRSAARALASVTHVPRGAVRFTVHDGRVLLTGWVDSGDQREAAERAVRATIGVVAVTNLIEIEPVSAPVPTPVPTTGRALR